MLKIKLTLFALALSTLLATAPSQAAVSWHSSISSAQNAAKKSGKPIVVYVWATWCGPCKLMAKNVFPNSKVQAEMKKWEAVKLDYDKSEAVMKKYKVSNALPGFLFLKRNGSLVSKTSGGKTSPQFIGLLKKNYSAAKK